MTGSKSRNTVRNARIGSKSSVASRAVDRAIERRRTAYEQEVTRLVEASFKLISETGNLEPKVSEIVAEAGLSNQAFYKHFRSKNELLLAVLDEGSHILCDYLVHQIDKANTPLQQVRCWINGVLAQALNVEAAKATRPFALSRARLSELFPNEVAESERQLTELLRDAIAAAKDCGQLPNADPQRDAEVVGNMVLAWLERKLSLTTLLQPDDVNHLIDFVMFGLKRGVETS